MKTQKKISKFAAYKNKCLNESLDGTEEQTQQPQEGDSSGEASEENKDDSISDLTDDPETTGGGDDPIKNKDGTTPSPEDAMAQATGQIGFIKSQTKKLAEKGMGEMAASIETAVDKINEALKKL